MSGFWLWNTSHVMACNGRIKMDTWNWALLFLLLPPLLKAQPTYPWRKLFTAEREGSPPEGAALQMDEVENGPFLCILCGCAQLVDLVLNE